MKTKELKQNIAEMTVSALKEEQIALLKEQFSYKIQRATGQLKKSHRMKEIRRTIARIKTKLTTEMKRSELQ
jgi:large subunit ribosomal protein L29